MLKNELMATGFESSLEADESTSTDERLYDYTNQREKGDVSNLYWGNINKQVTQSEMEELFNAEDNGQLRAAFGDFDNYLAYMNERQDLIDAGELNPEWWDTGRVLTDDELAMTGGMEDRDTEGLIRDNAVSQATDAYSAQSELLLGLYQKYTGNDGNFHYNGDGDKFEWNGTSFVKTSMVDDHNWGKMVPYMIASAVSGVAASSIMSAIGPKLAASFGLVEGTAGYNSFITGMTSGLGSIGNSLVTGRDLSKADLGRMLWDVVGPGLINAGLGVTPETFVSSFLDSVGGDLVAGIVNGDDIDWKDIFKDAAINGGMTSIKDFFQDWLSTKDKEELYQHYLQSDYATFGDMSPEEFDEWLFNNPDSLFQTSDLGGLVGKGGLLTAVFGDTFSDYVSTQWFDDTVTSVTSFLDALSPKWLDDWLSEKLINSEELQDDPFYQKLAEHGNPYVYNEELGFWEFNKAGVFTQEDLDRWNKEFLYGGALDERYWHSWQKRDPNSTVQGIWETAMTAEDGGIPGFLRGLVGEGGFIDGESFLPGLGDPKSKAWWEKFIDAWNENVSQVGGFSFNSDGTYTFGPSDNNNNNGGDDLPGGIDDDELFGGFEQVDPNRTVIVDPTNGTQDPDGGDDDDDLAPIWEQVDPDRTVIVDPTNGVSDGTDDPPGGTFTGGSWEQVQDPGRDVIVDPGTDGTDDPPGGDGGGLPPLPVNIPTGGMLAPENKWGELFDYTILKPHEKAKLTPYVDMLEKVKGGGYLS